VGKCIFCGRSAGLFSEKHEACERKHDSGWVRMVGDSRLAVLGKRDSRTLLEQLGQTAAASFIPSDRMRDAMTEGWGLAVEDYLNDGGLDENEERRLLAFGERFDLSRELLDRNGSLTRIAEAAAVRDLLYGIVPQRVKTNGNLPFTLPVNERLVWLFSGVEYLGQLTPLCSGGYRGAQVEVAKGQYYRPGGFCGNLVVHAGHAPVDSGSLAVATRHVYFAGGDCVLRLRHDQVVSLTPYTDGVAIQCDAETSRPHVFVTGDGWSTYNLLANIGNVSGW
jgi:hypothetical protein